MRSMTGFGAGRYQDERLSVSVEMRAVNQRFLELNIRMPHAYLALEDRLRQTIKQTVRRGKVDVFVTVQDLAPQAPQVRIDYASLEACRQALNEAGRRLFDGEKATLATIMELTKDWFVQEPPQIDADTAWPVFQQALTASLEGLTAMRSREGETICRDLQARTATMTKLIDTIASRKEDITAQYRQRLEKKILALLQPAQQIPDTERLLQETAIYADKVDFTEEVVRFRSHVLQLSRFLEQSGEVGRKLDFLIQEMNREVNTIGSKAGDMDVTDCVLQLKNELEKIREQIQNIE